MVWERFSTWLLTPAGRNFAFGGAAFASLSAFSAYYFPNTIFLDKYRELMQFYKSGFSEHVSPTLKARFEKALDLADVPEDEKHLFTPFHVIGFDMFSAGTVYSKYGCIVGLPTNFCHKDIDSVNKRDIIVGGNSVPWGLDEANLLLKSFVVSEKAQLYGMAREIKMLQTPKLLLDAFYATMACVGVYGFSINFNRKLNLYNRPRSFRLALYCLVCAFISGQYILAKDFTQIHYEKKIDEELKKKDPDLKKGGAEFYQKVMMRNQALRKLLGKEGEYYFTALGNENYLIRQKHIPLILRKEFFESDSEGLKL